MDEANLGGQFKPEKKNTYACKSCGKAFPNKAAAGKEDHYHGNLHPQVAKLSKSVGKYGHAQF